VEVAGKKKGSGANGGDVAVLTVEILKGIRSEIVGLRRDTNARFESLQKDTNARFGSLEKEISELRREMDQRFEALETATIRGFQGVASRLDNIVQFAGERWSEHERRIAALERKIDRSP
jgi:hypothetical protein